MNLYFSCKTRILIASTPNPNYELETSVRFYECKESVSVNTFNKRKVNVDCRRVELFIYFYFSCYGFQDFLSSIIAFLFYTSHNDSDFLRTFIVNCDHATGISQSCVIPDIFSFLWL